jgi:Kef-type K+ transport system membrane component KefB
MTETWMLAAIWLGLALIAAMFSVWLRIATALSEIVVGTLAQFILGIAFGASVLQGDLPWIKFLAGSGAILLTFLAGAELDPAVLRVRWKEATAVGLMSFLAPFIGRAVVAYAVLDWNIAASRLAGVALSTTSVAVYAVMLEFGLNTTDYGKTVLAACFITDLGTVLALGFIFSPFTLKTLIFFGVTIAVLVILPWLTPRFFRRYGGRPSEIEAKFLLVGLFALGAMVKSISRPIPVTTGNSQAKIARATTSSFKGHRSSSEPPPHARIRTSQSLRRSATKRAPAIPAAAPTPCGTG